MKVSIIVPVYNVEKYLDRCMSSLLGQTLRDLEIILVDDGSPDKCPQFCEKYKDEYSNIKVVHKKNAGLGFARNSGLEVCEGEYVAFIDSDDFADVHMFHELYTFAVENNLDACFCGYNIYKNVNDIKTKKEFLDYTLFRGNREVRNVLLDMVGSTPDYNSDVRILSSMWKGIYKLDVIRKNNLQFVSERQYIAEDIIFHLDFLPCCQNVGFVPGAYYNYCDNGTSLTRSYKVDRFEKELSQYKEMERRLITHKFTETEYRHRLDRYLLLKIRSCVHQQEIFASVYGYWRMRYEALTILKSPEVRSFIDRYPYKKLRLKHKLFFLMIKYKMIDVIFLLFKIGR